jgi:hypothetical protein
MAGLEKTKPKRLGFGREIVGGVVVSAFGFGELNQ